MKPEKELYRQAMTRVHEIGQWAPDAWKSKAATA